MEVLPGIEISSDHHHLHRAQHGRATKEDRQVQQAAESKQATTALTTPIIRVPASIISTPQLSQSPLPEKIHFPQHRQPLQTTGLGWKKEEK